MGLYGFKKQFVPFIEDGTKTHTIRSLRANPDKPGNVLHLYTGLRQKGARLLGRFICTKVEDILIDEEFRIFLSGDQLTVSEANDFAFRDGFRTYREERAAGSLVEMREFWKIHSLPFSGHVIHWKFEKGRK